MGILQRAIRSITRRKGKTIILFLIVFILGNVIAASVSVKQSTVNLEKQIKEQLGATSMIQADYEKIEKDQKDGIIKEGEWPTYSELNPSLETIKALGTLPQVNYYDYRLETSMESSTLKPYQQDEQFINPMFTLSGYALEEMIEIKEDKISLASGKLPTQSQIDKNENVAIISKQVAEQNAINVGDKITLNNKVYGFTMEREGENSNEPIAQQEVTLEVIGLFEVHTKKDDSKSKDGMGMQEWRNIEEMNRIYMPIGVVEKEMLWYNKEFKQMLVDSGEDVSLWEDDEMLMYTTKYVLKDPGELEAFKKDAAPYLSKYLKVVANSDSYDSIAQPIKKLSTIANYILIASTAVSILILTLIVILFLRDRKHELGIYLSLGESKIKVFQQIFIEVFAISILAMTLALFSGNLLARQVSKGMIDTNTNEYGMMYSFDDKDIGTEDVVDQYEVTFTPQIVLLYYGVGILTVLLSTAGPMFYILRLEPKKILM